MNRDDPLLERLDYILIPFTILYVSFGLVDRLLTALLSH